MDTRPTTDKVKESLFNIIQFEIEGRRVLDLFGGTGQLGIEALSRGADHCTFVDMRKEAAALIRENLRLTGLSERSRVVQGDALSFLSSCAQDSGSAVFSIPFDRQQLADYLAVERSAMSAELSRMKKDGLLDYHKNHFRLFTK